MHEPFATRCAIWIKLRQDEELQWSVVKIVLKWWALDTSLLKAWDVAGKLRIRTSRGERE